MLTLAFPLASGAVLALAALPAAYGFFIFLVLCNMPQRRQREAQDSDSIPCALICLFVLLSTWSALAIYICIWPSIKWVL